MSVATHTDPNPRTAAAADDARASAGKSRRGTERANGAAPRMPAPIAAATTGDPSIHSNGHDSGFTAPPPRPSASPALKVPSASTATTKTKAPKSVRPSKSTRSTAPPPPRPPAPAPRGKRKRKASSTRHESASPTPRPSIFPLLPLSPSAHRKQRTDDALPPPSALPPSAPAHEEEEIPHQEGGGAEQRPLLSHPHPLSVPSPTTEQNGEPSDKRNAFTISGPAHDEKREGDMNVERSASSHSFMAMCRGSVGGSLALHPSASRARRGSRAGSVASSFRSPPSRRPSIPAVPWNANSIFDLSPKKKDEGDALTPKKARRKQRVPQRHSQSDYGSAFDDNDDSSFFCYDEDVESDLFGGRHGGGGSHPLVPLRDDDSDKTSRPHGTVDEGLPTATSQPNMAGDPSPLQHFAAALKQHDAPHVPPQTNGTSRTSADVEAADGLKGEERRTPSSRTAKMVVKRRPSTTSTPSLPPPATVATPSAPIAAPPATVPGDRTQPDGERKEGNKNSDNTAGLDGAADAHAAQEEDPPGFYPPLYIQRALLCIKVLRQHQCFNFIDAGCSDGGLLQYVVKSQLIEHSFRNVVGIDVSKDALTRAEACLPFPQSSNAEYLHRVRVELVLGDLTLPPPVLAASPLSEESTADLGGGKLPTQRTPWLLMDRHYIRQQQQQQHHREREARRSGGGGESIGDRSYNDLSANFDDDSPAGAGNPNNRSYGTLDEEGGGYLPHQGTGAGLLVSPAQQPMDAVVSIEVLEHIPPHLVPAYTDTVFAQLAAQRGARVVILTTPNRAENARFDSIAGNSGSGGTKPGDKRSVYNPVTRQPRRRHPEHFFELTPRQFKAYCEYVVSYFRPYWDTYELVALGENFTQGAVFVSTAATQAHEWRQQPHRAPQGKGGGSTTVGSATASAVLSTSAYPQAPPAAMAAADRGRQGSGTGDDCGASSTFVPARMPMGSASVSGRAAVDSLGRWDFEDHALAGDGEEEEDPQQHLLSPTCGAAVQGTIVALQKGRGVDTSLRKRVAHKAAAVARRQSVGGGNASGLGDGAARKSLGPRAATSTKDSIDGKSKSSGKGKRGTADGKGRPSTCASTSVTPRASTGPKSAPASKRAVREPTQPTITPQDASDQVHELPKPLSSYERPAESAVTSAEGRARHEADFESTPAGAVGGSVGHALGSFAWSFSREERLEGFPFEQVFGMSKDAYRAEFQAQIDAMERTREGRANGTDPYFALTNNSASISLPLNQSTKLPAPGGTSANRGYVSLYRAVIPATSLWDRLCDAVFRCAQHLYRDMLSVCFVSRRGSLTGGGTTSSMNHTDSGGHHSSRNGSSVPPSTGMLTREGLMFGEIVLQRERATAFQPLRCTVCAVLTMLEEQRRLWYRNLLGDLRRWYGFARVRRIPPNSAFTMLSGLIHEVLPAAKHVSFSAAASWANAVPVDSIAIPNSAAYSALKSRPPADQKEGSEILKDLRLTQSGLRVHTWLLEEITRLALVHRRRVAAPSDSAPSTSTDGKTELVTTEDILNDDQTRLDAFLPDDVALVLLFMAAVDALPKASGWLRDRVPRWNPAASGGALLAGQDATLSGQRSARGAGTGLATGLSDADFDPSASVSRRRRLLRSQEERRQRASVRDGGGSGGVSAGSGGSYSTGGSSGLVGTAPSSNAALMLAASLSTFRVDYVVLEHLLGPPEDYITVEY